MSYSYSRVSTHNECPYKYKLLYIDKLEPKPDLRPNNPLFIGTAGHTGIETRDVEKAVESYKSNYNELTIDNEIEIYKLRKMVEKANEQIPEGEYEYKIAYSDGFIGYIDELVKVDEGVYDLYDFKFSQSANKYKSSPQVHIYKYFYEKLTGNTIRDMYFAVVPKVPEVLNEDMNQEKLIQLIDETYKKKGVQFIKIEYDPMQIKYFFAKKSLMDKSDKLGIYEKRYSTMCRWCPLQKYCQTNGTDKSELVEKENELKVEEISLF